MDSSNVNEIVNEIYQLESRRILSTLIRLTGDFDLAEDVMQEAFSLALQKWASEGIPTNPRTWLISVGKFKAIDILRRQMRAQASLTEVEEVADSNILEYRDDCIDDDLLRLIFTCCHPILSEDAQVALTLREVCDLSTDEIAKAFLSSPSTIAQRIVRAKAKIREERVSFAIPEEEELSDRLSTVLRVIYLVFNEGYYASSGINLTRQDLSGEAIRIGRLLASLLPDPEVIGLLGLMLLQESRRAARSSASGDLVLLDDQDRSLWNRELISEGQYYARVAFESKNWGPYALQAGIAAVHASAIDSKFTDWGRIISYYDLLLKCIPSPIVALNRAVAISMIDGPEAGLELVEPLLKELDGYGMAHSVKADLSRQLGRKDDAIQSYQRALQLTSQLPERRFLESRIDEILQNSN